VLAVFLVVYVGLFHMHKLQGNVLIARSQARSCAWRYSNAGCRDGAPAECGEANTSDMQLADDNDSDRGIMDSITDLGVIGPVLGVVLGTSVDLRVARTVKHTAMFGDNDVTVGARIYLMCNERNRTTEEIAKDTACALIPRDSFIGSKLGCGGERTWDK
jgi:hypothetical protein